MGIRFLCESCGKKLNIKQELAGKKGRCPKCDAKIRIPLRSTLESAKGATPDREHDANADNSNIVQPTGGGSPTDIQQPAGLPKIPVEIESESVAPGIQMVKPVASSQVVPTPPMVTTETPPPADPLSELPSAKWFVRPSSGGQFGPAEPDVMRSWLNEGRIGPDSLVWREGWEEWENAAKVFATELGTGSTTVKDKNVETSSDVESTSAYKRVYDQRRSRNRTKMLGIVLVVGLALVSIALAVVLFMVVNNSGKKNRSNEKTNPAKNESAMLYFEHRPNHNDEHLQISKDYLLSLRLPLKDVLIRERKSPLPIPRSRRKVLRDVFNSGIYLDGIS